MERNELFKLISNGLRPQVSTEFSKEDSNSAAIAAITEALGLDENATIRDIRACQSAAFALIEEALDKEVPKALENVLGRFAEIQTFGRNDEVVFKLGKMGKNRAKLGITKGARGGIYRARRLDTASFQVPVGIETVGIFVTLEDLLSGTYTLAELYANIVEGFQERIYVMTVKALTDANAAVSFGDNHVQVSSSLTLEQAVIDSVNVVKQYGSPLILGFYSQIAKLTNKVADRISEADLDEIRRVGYISIFKGTPVVEIPNYLVNETNEEWVLDDQYVYVIPADAKPVKVALKGDTVIEQHKDATGSEKMEVHKLIGIGVAFNNNYKVIDCVE